MVSDALWRKSRLFWHDAVGRLSLPGDRRDPVLLSGHKALGDALFAIRRLGNLLDDPEFCRSVQRLKHRRIPLLNLEADAPIVFL